MQQGAKCVNGNRHGKATPRQTLFRLFSITYDVISVKIVCIKREWPYLFLRPAPNRFRRLRRRRPRGAVAWE